MWATAHTGQYIQWTLKPLEHDRDAGTVTEHWGGVFLVDKKPMKAMKKRATTAHAAKKKAKAAMKKAKVPTKAKALAKKAMKKAKK